MSTTLDAMPKKKIPTKVTRVPIEQLHTAEIIAAAFELSLPEYLGQALDSALKRDLPKAMAILERKRKGQPADPL